MEHNRDIIPATDAAHGVSRRGTATREEALYICDVCGEVEPYHVKLTGRYLRQPCQCQLAEVRREKLAAYKVLQLREQMRYTFDWLGDDRSDLSLVEKTFENFQVYRQQDAYDAARAFCLNMEGRCLTLYGSYGTGKTHLLAAVCNELRVGGQRSRFTTAPKLFRAMQERIGSHGDYMHLMRVAITTPLLLIDDIDKAKPSEWKEEIYFELLDERTKRGLPIAISTNKLSELAHYIGGAACSRLSIGQIAVEMAGADFRMEM